MVQRVVDVRALRTIRRGEDADALTLAVYEQVITLLEGLEPQEWGVVTGYRGWTVHDTVAHLVGSAASHASVLEHKRQAGHASRRQLEEGLEEVEARIDFQKSEFAGLPPAQLVFRLRALAPRAVAGRQRRENWFGAEGPRRSNGGEPSGSSAISLAQMCNVSLARDVWLHRFDIAEATGRDLRIDKDVDGAILSGIVAEWCERHGDPVELVLTGHLAGRFVSRTDGPRLRMDGLDFCRVVAGRSPQHPVPVSPLLDVGVDF